MELRYWSATHTPVRNKAGTVAYVLQYTVDLTELHGLRAVREEMGVIKRADAVQAHDLDLSEETHQLKALFEQTPGFIAILSGPGHRFQMVNEANADVPTISKPYQMLTLENALAKLGKTSD